MWGGRRRKLGSLRSQSAQSNLRGTRDRALHCAAADPPQRFVPILKDLFTRAQRPYGVQRIFKENRELTVRCGLVQHGQDHNLPRKHEIRQSWSSLACPADQCAYSAAWRVIRTLQDYDPAGPVTFEAIAIRVPVHLSGLVVGIEYWGWSWSRGRSMGRRFQLCPAVGGGKVEHALGWRSVHRKAGRGG